MTRIPFVKATACGNDFLIIDAKYAPASRNEFSKTICDRHNGVGADGVEWVTISGAETVDALLINADGSPAEISGNGTRCVGAWYISNHGGQKVMVLTGAGTKPCTLVSRHESRFVFETGFGKPTVQGQETVQGVKGIEISLGNPHFVVFVPNFDFDWRSLGARIQSDKRFKHGTNVEFVRVQSQQRLEVRFFERGVGETLSSGTGSCASAVAATHTGRTKSPVEVVAPGGSQTVRWDQELILIGPAHIVCEGEFLWQA